MKKKLSDPESFIPNGAFLLARKGYSSDLWRNKPATWLKIWIYILGHVQHTDFKELKRGEGFFNFTDLIRTRAFGIDVTKNMSEKFLKYARQQHMVTSKKATHGIVITVINYNYYQSLQNYVYPDLTGINENESCLDGNISRNKSGIELASKVRLDSNIEADKKAESQAEQKRNRSGNINKNDNNVKNINNLAGAVAINEIQNYFLRATDLPIESGRKEANRRYWSSLLKSNDFPMWRGMDGVKNLISIAVRDKKEQGKYAFKITSAQDLFYKRADLYNKYCLPAVKNNTSSIISAEDYLRKEAEYQTSLENQPE